MYSLTWAPTIRRRATRLGAFVALAIALPQYSAGAQQTDSRWTPYLGCWAPIEAGVISLTGPSATDNLVCVVPATGSSVVVASIVGGKIIARTSVDAGGARNVKNVDDCAGWESAKWSADGYRVMLRSEYRCGNNTVRKESGVFSMTPEGQWLDVQGVDVMGTTTTRAVRFRDINVDPAALRALGTAAIGDSVRVAASGQPSFQTATLRTAASGRITPDDVLDVSRNVDVPVAEAWLNETGQQFAVDARTLVKLADAGMPSRMIDLLVALSYPKTFAVRPTMNTANPGHDLAMRANSRIGYGGFSSSRSMCDAFFGRYQSLGYFGSAFDDCYGMSRYGSLYNSYGYGYGSRYGNGYYYGSQPIIIIDRGSGSGSGSGGMATNTNPRAVNGRGYTRDNRPDPTSMSGTSRGGAGASASPSSSSSSGSQSSGSSSGESGGRTAKPRPPQ